MTRRPVELRIDELVLEGLDGVDAPVVARAVEKELARLLAERGLPDGDSAARSVARLRGGTIQAVGGGSSEQGIRIARAIYEGVTGRPAAGPLPPSPPADPARPS